MRFIVLLFWIVCVAIAVNVTGPVGWVATIFGIFAGLKFLFWKGSTR